MFGFVAVKNYISMYLSIGDTKCTGLSDFFERISSLPYDFQCFKKESVNYSSNFGRLDSNTHLSMSEHNKVINPSIGELVKFNRYFLQDR